ncbi:hypothetical protein [Deinococcus hopiensis]|uniref:E9imm peptide n=1 Tax=Deinococcus hopiensis KR-140 TaxID=695939 RepID=A0A1W1UJG6_9DEIO|nr:hypothetical protein [Deinococcus hopiensis]SMB81258.1 hypothetical protein SAMN00790413_04513 [Deinococcus hopiensis KR-140]
MIQPFGRTALVALVQRLLDGDYQTEDEADEMINLLRDHLLDPQVTDYIFGSNGEQTAEEIVDRAQAYTPIVATYSRD